MRQTPLAAVLLTAALALAGCDMLPAAAGPVARDADEAFELVLRVGSTRYAPNQPIGASASLSYLGPEARVDLVGSGSGLVVFSVKQLDGGLDLGGGQTADCQMYRLDRGRPMEAPFRKSGGWTGEDPDAAFYQAYFNDPVFRLPRGRWQISGAANFYVGECGGVSHALGAEVTIVVE